jgi:hypothetical protein
MSGFLNRWAKRKAGLESDEPVIEEKSKLEGATTNKAPPPLPLVSEKNLVAKSNEPKTSDGVVNGSVQVIQSEQVSAPTLEDVLKLTKDSDFSAYVQSGIDPNVQQAALNKLFSDPHYNIMDGLDIYIDDYNKSDPIPLEMLKKMNQSQMLGLFKTPEEKETELQAELIERKEYKERLAKIDADEADVAAAKLESDTADAAETAEAAALKEKDLSKQSLALEDSAVLPNENANGINAANSSELNNLQETTNITKTNSVLNRA